MYRLFILLGAKRIQEVMEAKGYILGTSQVIPPILLCTTPCMGAVYVINQLNSLKGVCVFVTTHMDGIQFVDKGRLQAHSQRMLACVVASAAGIDPDKQRYTTCTSVEHKETSMLFGKVMPALAMLSWCRCLYSFECQNA